MPNVYVAVLTEIPSGDPVEDVQVALYLENGTYVTDVSTDADGMAFLGDRAVGSYEIRITPPAGRRAVHPVQTLLVTGTDDNVFEARVDITGRASASDPRMCRCSGTFVDPFGAPAVGLRITFTPYREVHLLPQSGGSLGVVQRSKVTTTDHNGFASVDLIRASTYHAIVPGYDSWPILVTVPDASNAPLPDVLFPSVDVIEYRDDGVLLSPVDAPEIELSLAAGERALTTETVLRSGLRQEGLVGVCMEVSDREILTCVLSVSGVILRPKAVGTVTIQAGLREKEEATQEAPARGFARGTLTVVVVP